MYDHYNSVPELDFSFIGTPPSHFLVHYPLLHFNLKDYSVQRAKEPTLILPIRVSKPAKLLQALSVLSIWRLPCAKWWRVRSGGEGVQKKGGTMGLTLMAIEK